MEGRRYDLRRGVGRSIAVTSSVSSGGRTARKGCGGGLKDSPAQEVSVEVVRYLECEPTLCASFTTSTFAVKALLPLCRVQKRLWRADPVAAQTAAIVSSAVSRAKGSSEHSSAYRQTPRLHTSVCKGIVKTRLAKKTKALRPFPSTGGSSHVVIPEPCTLAKADG